MKTALGNLRVLDLSRVLAGPWAGQLLGDYGADVVKVERPGSGDDTRQWGPPWLSGQNGRESAYFLCANRNKRSLTVDLKKPAGQALVRELAARADVLLENFRVGTLARLGLGADTLLKKNPALIYASVSAYGQTGPRAEEPGYDAMIQASAGLMSITGPPDDEPGGPQKVGVAIADIMAGMYAVTAILAALNARNATGAGQHIDVPLYDSQVAWLANQNMNYLVGGNTPKRLGTAHPNLVPYQVFTASDGDFVLAVGNDRQFRDCCDVVAAPELADDPRFATNADRVANRAALVASLQQLIGQRSIAHWLQTFAAVRVPTGPVNSIATVLSDAHAEQRQLVRKLRNSDGEAVPTVANPVAFEATPVTYRHAPPSLGEHSGEILRDWLGYSDADVAKLRSDAII